MVDSHQRTYGQVRAGIDFHVFFMCFLNSHRGKMENQTLYLCLSDGMACKGLPTEYGAAERNEK